MEFASTLRRGAQTRRSSSKSGCASASVATECPEPLCPRRALPPAGRSRRPPGRALPLRPRSYGLMRRTVTLPAPPVVPLCARSLHVFVSPCWATVLPTLSLHPCAGAWTHTPPSSSSALVHFFLEDTGLAPREPCSVDGSIPAMQLPQGAVFRGGSHSLRFRLLRSLGPHAAPTAALAEPGRRAVFTTHLPAGHPVRAVASLRVRSAQLTRLDSHQLGCSLVGCSF